MSEREALIEHRLQRASEALEEARLLLEAHHLNAALNRLYYACFYAVNALLLQHGFSSSKHSGVRSLFGQHFVKTGSVPQQLGETYNRLFDLRQQGDYADLFLPSEQEVAHWLQKAEEFVGFITEMVRTEIR